MPIAPPLVVRGGDYPSQQAPDGTWAIRGVPLFAEHVYTDPETGKKTPITKEWLDRCVEGHQAEYARNGYLPPAHVNHHDFGTDPVTGAGFFLPTHVAKGQTREGEVWTIYGDLVGVTPEAFQRIVEKRLPYLSCEALLKRERLESLALLPTRPPYHKFTPLTVRVPGGTKKFLDRDENVVGYAASVGGARVLTRISMPMDATEKKDDEQAKPPAAPPEKPAQAADAPPAPAAQPAAPAPTPAPDPMAAVTAQLTSLTSMVAQLLKALAPAPPEAGQPAPMVGAPSSASYADVAKTVAKLEGEVAGLRVAHEQSAKAAEDEKFLAGIDRQLEPYAYAVPKIGETLRRHFAAGGRDAVTAYAEAIRSVGRADPTRTTLDDVASSGEALPKEIAAKYAAEPPSVQAELARMSRDFDAFGGERALGMSRIEYVDVEMSVRTRKSA